MNDITQFVLNILEKSPSIAYLTVGIGIFFAATFPFSFFWYGEFIFIPASILIGIGKLKIFPVFIASVIGALIGDMINYFLGYRYGRQMFHPDKRFLNPETLEKGEKFFQKYGVSWVFLAKFVPLIPWTVSFLAGVHKMNLIAFIMIDILAGCVIFGGIYWGFSGGIHIIAELWKNMH